MEINISYEIERLIQFGRDKSLIESQDKDYTRNRIMEVLGVEGLEEVEVLEEKLDSPEPILDNILEWAYQQGILKENNTASRDLIDTKVMGCLISRPSEVISKFSELYRRDVRSATDYFYTLNRNSNYIRVNRIKRDLKWETKTEYGNLEITINLSKPEKDPKSIAAEKDMPSGSYPKCLLCRENEGYSGRLNHPARQNHRVIPLFLNGEEWFFQYSPYVYYNEHCIVLNGKHEPMKLCGATFIRLLDFIEQFPHYFIGSNADLPIVGGSILSHDHFQGGYHEFPMARAESEAEFKLRGAEDIRASRVKWPMSVIRLEGNDKERLAKAAFYIYKSWQDYSDEGAGILSHTGVIPHNTVTPMARMAKGRYQMDIVLRNNRATEEYPEGIFHPHRELHHIKKENIGLIEVMGLAVLPARLRAELGELSYYLLNKEEINKVDENSSLKKHKDWCKEVVSKYDEINKDNVWEILQREAGLRFLRVLEDAGVFKRTPEGIRAFEKFTATL